jgi:hypothetical protein
MNLFPENGKKETLDDHCSTSHHRTAETSIVLLIQRIRYGNYRPNWFRAWDTHPVELRVALDYNQAFQLH